MDYRDSMVLPATVPISAFPTPHEDCQNPSGDALAGMPWHTSHIGEKLFLWDEEFCECRLLMSKISEGSAPKPPWKISALLGYARVLGKGIKTYIPGKESICSAPPKVGGGGLIIFHTVVI